jgi:hypothetical protein
LSNYISHRSFDITTKQILKTFPVSAGYLRKTLNGILESFGRFGIPQGAEAITTTNMYRDNYIALETLLGKTPKALLKMKYEVSNDCFGLTVENNVMTLHEHGFKENLLNTYSLVTIFLLSPEIKNFVISYDAKERGNWTVMSITMKKTDKGILELEQYELYADIPYSFKLNDQESYLKIEQFLKDKFQ